MRLELSSMQQELRATVRAVCTSNAEVEGLWAQCGERNWLNLTVPVVHGGLGLGEPEAVLFAEEVGYSLGPQRLVDELAGVEPARHESIRCLRGCAYLLGVASRAAELAVVRAREHRQFGTAIAHFQAVSFPLAAHHIRLNGLRWRVWELARELDVGAADSGDIAEFAPLLRRWTFAAVNHAVHVHGASGLADETMVSRCYRAMLTFVEAAGDSDATATSSLPRLRDHQSDTLWRRVPPSWTGQVADELPNETITSLFTAAAARCGDLPAVEMAGENTMTYRELDERSNQLAHVLRQVGVGSDTVVGIYLPRCTSLPVALLGVLKAGGAYLPLDPDYPAERISMMIGDSGAAAIIAEEWLLEWLPESAATLVCLDRDRSRIHEQPRTPSPEPVGGRDLAYLIYTSGSSGTPKGVRVEHRGVVNRLRWDQRTFPLGAGDAVLHHTSLSFDIAVWEIFTPLVSGARLVLARQGGSRDADYLTETAATEGITALAVVPSLLDVLLEAEPGLAAAQSLRYVFSGGEVLSPSLCERLFATAPAVELHNFYGPSEATVDVTSWQCTPENIRDGVPIGRPLDNVRVYVLDDLGIPVPAGTAGELYVGGVGVARGYHNRLDLTRSRFLPDPFATGMAATMYRTGDLVRYRKDGAVEFLGRTDEQVKVRGFRVELGEIESALEQHPTVRQAAVTVVGHDRLDAFVACFESRAQLSERDLQAHLRKRLPSHMLPASVTIVPGFPLLPSGKVDRASLQSAAPVQPRGAGGEDEPVGRVAQLMGQVLGVPTVAADDDFFELGGTSLQAARFVTRARNHLGLQLDLQTFLEAPTCGAVVGWNLMDREAQR